MLFKNYAFGKNNCNPAKQDQNLKLGYTVPSGFSFVKVVCFRNTTKFFLSSCENGIIFKLSKQVILKTEAIFKIKKNFYPQIVFFSVD